MKRLLVNITIPVLNEEAQLAANIRKVRDFVLNHTGFRFEIVIADNGSVDETPRIARSLAREFEEVRIVCLKKKGRGRAIKQVWTDSEAYILSYMDVDLSTDLESFPALIEPLASGRFDLSIGSRLLPDSRVSRGLKRETISRCYNLLVRAVFQTRFKDAQCGFKAITRGVARQVLPKVVDDSWFMDTEMLVLAQYDGFKVCEVPVRWVDDPDSRVAIIRTAIEDIRGIMRLRKTIRKSRQP